MAKCGVERMWVVVQRRHLRLACFVALTCAVVSAATVVLNAGRAYAAPYTGPFNFYDDGTVATVTGCAADCSGTNLVIPATDGNGHPVVLIEEKSFQNLGLTSVTFPNSITGIAAYSFFGNNLTTLTLPDSLGFIGSGVFEQNLLTTLTIPNTVTSIDVYAFQRNSLTTVTIGSSVATMEIDAFAQNPLTTMHFLGNRPAAYGTLPSLTCLTYIVGKTGWPGGLLYGATPQESGSCPKIAPTTTVAMSLDPTTTDVTSERLVTAGSRSGDQSIVAIVMIALGYLLLRTRRRMRAP